MTEKNEREFARFEVCLQARFEILESQEEIDDLRNVLLEQPSVWVPSGQSQLEKLASAGRGAEGVLAQAVLDLGAQMEQITHRLLDLGGPMEVGSLVQLSGNGGQLGTGLLLESGKVLDLRIMDEGMEAPPIRSMVQLVHGQACPPDRYGFQFLAIHPSDQERLIRYLYQLQRRKLRRASMEEP